MTLKIERVEIVELSPDPANLRRHPDKNLNAIKASLRRFGQQKPIVVDEANVVRAGNGTLAAAIALGWKEIDIVRSSLTGVDAVAYAIADNRTAELAEWDSTALKSVLEDLPEEYVEDLGWEDEDLSLLSESQEEGDGKSDEEVIASMDAVLATHQPLERGTVVKCGTATLIVACPTNDLDKWLPMMQGVKRFVPYPSVFSFCSRRNLESQTLMVQPDGLIAATAIAVAKANGLEVQVSEEASE